MFQSQNTHFLFLALLFEKYIIYVSFWLIHNPNFKYYIIIKSDELGQLIYFMLLLIVAPLCYYCLHTFKDPCITLCNPF